ncbi:MAG TPA: asparagine synthase (glutamine-hydrolyzing) [Isosphaeraceae bacterium]|nr:asparagine synthase (glutamine-hydrolyzing) [Isosphaeraceae bacterium]
MLAAAVFLLQTALRGSLVARLMCGIAGFVNRGGEPADREVLAGMTETLVHRGPDGQGAWLQGPAALGHRRLSIIDLAGGAQPMANEDGSVWITYNGELYNEPALRTWLQARGHVFRTVSDTEAIVHLYEEHGPDFARHLNGMFALALWDNRRSRLVLARDRMGQKPLYYAEASGAFVFGSEPKALLAHPAVGRQLDPNGLARYLFYEYLPAPHSIWSGLRKLPAAHVLVWEHDRAAISRYWQPPPPTAADLDFGATAEQFWTDFRAAVGRHRRSDVPLGVFLSGGIDSSSVAAAVTELEPAHHVRTFSIGFSDQSFDESHYARLVAQDLGTDHHEWIFSAEKALELLPEVARWMDEPFGDASILPTHLLSRFARTEVTVALGGDGADELLAGYPTFTAERAAGLFRRLPRQARALAGAAVGLLPVDHGNVSFDFKLKQFLRGAAEPAALAHQRWLGSFSGSEIARLLDPGAAVTIDVEAEHLKRARSLAPAADPLTRALALYQDTYLPEDILTKVDRASMACSLEVRAPFLDIELVDAIEGLPASFKYGRGQTKRLLKRAAMGRLPASILERPKKGFGIPVARWLRGPLSNLLDELLAPDRLRRQGLFRPEEVARRIGEHRAGVRDHRKPLWTLLMFQMWHDQWL